MLRAANSIYSSQFAVWPANRSVLKRAVCHLASCSDIDNNGKQPNVCVQANKLPPSVILFSLE